MDNRNSTHHDTEQSNDAPLTPEEREQYKKLIAEAYPQPKRNLSEEVMRQIRKETEQKERRRRLLNRMVQIGRIAACFLAVFGVITAIVPYLNRSTKDSAYEPLTADYLRDDGIPYTTVTNSAGTQKTEDADLSLSAEMPEAEDFEPQAPCEVYSNPLSDDCCSTIIFCNEHDSAGSVYHQFSAELINHIGAEAFSEWLNSDKAIDECGAPSVRTLVRAFGISRETFKEITKTGTVSYDPDIIYTTEQ